MHPDLERLEPYPFQRLAALLGDATPALSWSPVALSIGEPKHAAADFLLAAATDVAEVRSGLGTYPITRGSDALRCAISQWLKRRFNAGVNPDHEVLPVNGTREALFSFGQAVLSGRRDAVALLPNPFYQIYEGAIVLRGATPYYLATDASNGYLPDFSTVPEDVWRRCELLYLCSPGNPSGAVLSLERLHALLDLRDRHDFVIAADECYSEIYTDEASPPAGLLQACASSGRDDFRGCVVFHSLSKRSNLPGLRSGFVAGDAALLAPYFEYRTYHGCAMPAHVQAVSVRAWQDETHVLANREAYRNKFDAVLPLLQPVLDVERPEAAFYLWPRVPAAFNDDDAAFARALYAERNIKVLPGSFLGRPGAAGNNPGAGHVRLALVAGLDDCISAAQRMADWLAP